MGESGSAGLGLRLCISNSFPGAAAAAGPNTTVSSKSGAKGDLHLTEKKKGKKNLQNPKNKKAISSGVAGGRPTWTAL